MRFVVVPVVLGEGVFARHGGGIFENRRKIDALHRWRCRDVREREDRRCDVDGADKTLRSRARFGDALRPMRDERRLHARIMQPRLGTRKRTAIVGHHEDESVVECALLFELRHDAADEVVVSRDLVVVGGEIVTRGDIVIQIRRHNDLRGIVLWTVKIGFPVLVPVPGAVRIQRGEPEEERFVLGALLDGLHPGRMPALVVGCHAFVHEVKWFGLRLFALGRLVGSHVMLADERGVVAGLSQQTREPRQMCRDGLMQLRRATVVVRIAARDDAGTAGAATACHQDRLIKAPAVHRETVDVRRARCCVAIAAEIVPAHVISDKEDHIRTIRSVSEGGDGQEEQEKSKHGQEYGS